MNRIYKYTLEKKCEQIIKIPSHYILSVANQNDNIVVYAVVSDDIEPIEYKFFIQGTGSPISLEWYRTEFLGTVLSSNGNFVFHIFYDKRVMRGV